MISSIIFISTFLLLVVQGFQLNFNSIKPVDTNLMTIKDTAQAHYESVIDDILSQHNEGLLTELSIVVKSPHDMYSILKPQADLLVGSDSSIQDVCVAQMPGMIANQIHELSNELYSSVDAIVTEYWTTTDMEYRQLVLNAVGQGYWEQDVLDELVNSLEILNMDIADQLIAAIDRFNLLNKMESALLSCQSVFDKEDLDATNEKEEATLTEKIWSALLISFNQPAGTSSTLSGEPPRQGFLNRFIFELTSDLQAELYARVYELARGVYEDLAFGA